VVCRGGEGSEEGKGWVVESVGGVQGSGGGCGRGGVGGGECRWCAGEVRARSKRRGGEVMGEHKGFWGGGGMLTEEWCGGRRRRTGRGVGGVGWEGRGGGCGRRQGMSRWALCREVVCRCWCPSSCRPRSCIPPLLPLQPLLSSASAHASYHASFSPNRITNRPLCRPSSSPICACIRLRRTALLSEHSLMPAPSLSASS
jgi:hypothetical protein